jgi:hypothetical protein
MAGLPEVTPAYFEILVVRELRKVGLEVTASRVHRRTELPEPERGFLLELRLVLSGGGGGGWRKRALVACRHQTGPVGREAVEELAGRVAEAEADVGVLFADVDFDPDALTAASERGIALLELVDAHVAFDAGGWGAPGHYPAWLPAHLTRLVDRDPAGQTRTRLLLAGQASIILERLQAEGGVP